MVILLVEDDLPIQRFVSKLLNADGFTVMTAGDGEAALEVSRTFSASIDLLLSDVKCPGYDVRCDKCGVVKLTLAEFREQMSNKAEQTWSWPKCGSVAEFSA